MMTDDEIIAVVQAHKEGKRIEFRPQNRLDSYPWAEAPRNQFGWRFNDTDYRVKPEPREWWIVLAHSQSWQDVAFRNEESAHNYDNGYKSGSPIVHVREVLE